MNLLHLAASVIVFINPSDNDQNNYSCALFIYMQCLNWLGIREQGHMHEVQWA